jgi:hypothetical protein
MSSAPDDQRTADPVGADDQSPQFTSVHRTWRLKMILFWVALVGFGTWGLLDATWIYPRRGWDHAEYLRFEYLRLAQEAGAIAKPGALSVADPSAELRRLGARRDDLLSAVAGGAGGAGRDEGDELPKKVLGARLAWLESLARVSWPGSIAPDKTRVDDPAAELAALQAKLANAVPPTGLAGWDLPLQWVFTFVGYGGAIWMAAIVIPAMRRRYQWDPRTLTLTCPDGQTIVPSQIAELDKRKWDKLYITLVFNDGRPARQFDLQVYVPLEDWILDMERARFPEQSAEAGAESSDASGAAEATQGAGPA